MVLRSGSELPHNVNEFTPDTFECYINFPGVKLVCDPIRKWNDVVEPLHPVFLIGVDHFPCELPKFVHLRVVNKYY